MMIYTGQSRGRDWCSRLISAELGECCVRGELPPRRSPWFYDNGAYGDFLAGRSFDSFSYERDMRRIRLWSQPGPGVPGWDGRLLPLPDLIVLPDRVAAGQESIAFTERFLPGGIEAPIGGYAHAPLLIAVQDGMEIAEVAAFIVEHRLGGIFVGGTMHWKLSTAAQWVRIAHRLGGICHVGRAVSHHRQLWAQRIGADSVDGNAPNWSREGLERVVRTRASRQLELMGCYGR